MRTLDRIITKVDCRLGSPMGRQCIDNRNEVVVKGVAYRQTKGKIFDCAVPMCGAYDKGGAYWGLGRQLRVRYTKDLNFVHFYRVGDR